MLHFIFMHSADIVQIHIFALVLKQKAEELVLKVNDINKVFFLMLAQCKIFWDF